MEVIYSREYCYLFNNSFKATCRCFREVSLTCTVRSLEPSRLHAHTFFFFCVFLFAIFSHASSIVRMEMLVCGSVGQCMTLVQAEIAQHLLDGLSGNLVQTFMIPRG